LAVALLLVLLSGKMVSFKEHRCADEDSVSVCSTCPAQDDYSQSPREEESHDEMETGNANVSSIKTASFWDDREMLEPLDSSVQDPMQSQDMSMWVAVPVVSLPMVPVAPCTSAYPGADQLMQQAKDLTMKAEELEAEARRLKNPRATDLLQEHVGDASTNGSWTTVMLRNIPNNITRAGLLELFQSNCFPTTSFDFCYLPMDFKRDANLGYAFVNLVSAKEATRFFQFFQGFEGWGLASEKVGDVCWGQPLQGLEKHIDRYRNSPVMHSSVPEEHKPMLFCNGTRIPFPEPTKKLRAPRAPARN
jgi:RNA recognition motif-containing protein